MNTINYGIIGATLLPNVGGWLSTVTMIGQYKRSDGKAWYQLLKKPSWIPPGWTFGPTWTVLYAGMGYASYIIYRECGGFTDRSVVPMTLYGGQLLLNWAWTTVFFGLHKLGLAFWHILALDVAALACTASFYKISSKAGHLMLPYLAWLAVGTCLTYSTWILNK